jgi:hypothetical protein
MAAKWTAADIPDQTGRLAVSEELTGVHYQWPGA